MIDRQVAAKRLTGGVAAMLLLLDAGAAGSADRRAPEPSKPVDAARFYTGVWREIGRRPMKLTDGCVAGTTQYTLAGTSKVKVRDTCAKGSPTGVVKAIGGPATILDPGKNTKLHVSYRFLGVIPVERDYWVLDHDEQYSWFISADPSFRDLWIYTRDPHVDPALLAQLVDRAKALGYDVSKLEFPAQP